MTCSPHWSKNIICDLRVDFDWLRAWFGKQLPQTNPRCFPVCDAVPDSGPLERTIEAKWVRKQTWTGNMSSNGHLALPELIWRLVGWAYATETHRPDTHTYRHTLAPHHLRSDCVTAHWKPKHAGPSCIRHCTYTVQSATGTWQLKWIQSPHCESADTWAASQMAHFCQ